MLEISTTNVLLVLAVWVFAFYIAVKRLSAVQRLLAFSLHHVLRRYAAVDSNGKPSCHVTSTTTGTIRTHSMACIISSALLTMVHVIYRKS